MMIVASNVGYERSCADLSKSSPAAALDGSFAAAMTTAAQAVVAGQASDEAGSLPVAPELTTNLSVDVPTTVSSLATGIHLPVLVVSAPGAEADPRRCEVVEVDTISLQGDDDGPSEPAAELALPPADAIVLSTNPVISPEISAGPARAISHPFAAKPGGVAVAIGAIPSTVADATAIPVAVAIEVRKPPVERNVESREGVAFIVNEQRAPLPVQALIDRAVPAATPADRAPVFAMHIAEAARDVLAATGDADVHFSVRPERLGPVFVTIERGDAGSSVRLGLDTPAQVQAVRQAETILNDARGGSPFVEVTVDLASEDARGRSARAPVPVRPAPPAPPGAPAPDAPVRTGRFA